MDGKRSACSSNGHCPCGPFSCSTMIGFSQRSARGWQEPAPSASSPFASSACFVWCKCMVGCDQRGTLARWACRLLDSVSMADIPLFGSLGAQSPHDGGRRAPMMDSVATLLCAPARGPPEAASHGLFTPSDPMDWLRSRPSHGISFHQLIPKGRCLPRSKLLSSHLISVFIRRRKR